MRDLYVFAYERSTQEYLALKQDVAEPERLRLRYRDTLLQCVREAVRHPAAATLATVAQCVAAAVPPDPLIVVSDRLRLPQRRSSA